MKKACAWCLLWLVLCLPAMGQGESEAEGVAFWVNGDAVYQAEIDAMMATLTESMAQLGLDTSDATVLATIKSVAQQQIIEDRLLTRDMTEQGMYDWTAEDESAVTASAQAAFDALLADYTAYYAGQEESGEGGDAAAAQRAQEALETAGYTLGFFENYYRNALASERYEAWLMRGEAPVTDEAVETAYQQRVAESEGLYAQDVEAFETALASGQEVWYRPAGYRAVLQILLSAQGDTEAEKLASVEEKTDEIYARLEAGEAFESLIAEYGEDSAFDDPEFARTGYQVHPDSVLWEESFVQAVFSDALARPGDVSQPLVFGDNVHILYYLADVEAGAVALTDDLREALRAALYGEQVDARLEERLDSLLAGADIVFAESE